MRNVVAALLLTVAACGGGADTTTTAADAGPEPTTAPEPTAASEAAADAPTTTMAEATEFCGDDATGIEAGTSVEDRVEMDGDFPEDLYFCVDIPGGVSLITVTLSGQEDDLNLYVGYPDLATVQGGGFTFWFSDNNSTDDESVVVEPGFQKDTVEPGPYYIEVSGEVSSFTLLVETD